MPKPRPIVLRWGKSSYETSAQLRLEAEGAERLGCVYVFSGDDEPTGLADARVVIVPSGTKVDEGVVAQAPNLELLLTTTSGYDHLDLGALRRRGIQAARCPLARRDAVVETATAMALSLLRDFESLREEARGGRWARASLPTRQIASLRGLRVGVLGLGVIGRRQVELLQSFGAEVVGYDPSPVAMEIPRLSAVELVATARVLFLHCSHRPGRPPVIDRDLLAAARSDLLLINTARGQVLDLDAAWEAIQDGRLGGLGVDVFAQEPFGDLASLVRHPRVIVTPHAAGYHDGLGEAIAKELAAALLAWREGNPLPSRLI